MAIIPKAAIQKRADAINRVYFEFSKKLTALQKNHHKEITQLLRELEQRKIEEIRKVLLEK